MKSLSHRVNHHGDSPMRSAPCTNRTRYCEATCCQFANIQWFWLGEEIATEPRSFGNLTATAPRIFERKGVSHKKHTTKNQKLISHRSESDVCEMVLLIFLGHVGGTRLPNGAFMQKASCRKWHELLAHRRGIFCPSPNLFQKHMFLTCDFL